MPKASRQELVEQDAVTEGKMACFQRVEELQFHKTFCLEQLIVSHLPSINFLEVGLTPRQLADGL
jgi:hypothetical protein